MVGLLSAARLRCQRIVECLSGDFVLIYESWGHLTQVLGVPWGTLACCVGLLLFMVSRRWNSRRPEAQGRSCAARHEVPGNRGDSAERTTPAVNTGRPPAGEARPPTVQSLSLAVETTPLRLTLQDTPGPLAQGWESQPPTLAKATDKKLTLRASLKDGEQLGKKRLYDWNGNTAFPERAEVPAQDIARCRQKLKEKEEEKEELLRLNARVEQDLKEGVSRLLSAAETLLHAVPALAPRTCTILDGGSLEVAQKRVVGICKHPVPGSEVALKADLHDADAPVSPQSPERAGSLREQKQELRKQTAALQAEETSLRREILELESQLLQLQLQNLVELRQELESQIAKEEKRCAEIKKKLINLCRNRNSKFQILQLHKKIAEDMGKELERTRSFYQREFLLHKKRARESWKAAVLTERNLMEVRREGDCIRRMLADAQAHLQPFPSGPSAPVAPPVAHRGHNLSWGPLNPQAPPGRRRVSP